jgi:hypothetical protein
MYLLFKKTLQKHYYFSYLFTLSFLLLIIGCSPFESSGTAQENLILINGDEVTSEIGEDDTTINEDNQNNDKPIKLNSTS